MAYTQEIKVVSGRDEWVGFMHRTLRYCELAEKNPTTNKEKTFFGVQFLTSVKIP